MRIATLDILIRADNQASKVLDTLADKVRFVGARLRNAGIGMTIAMAPFGMALNNAVNSAMEFDKLSRGLSKVAVATGRDIDDILSIIDKHSGELMSKIDLTRGVMKLLSTSLTNVQIDQFIEMVKNGASAMGEDMSSAFAMVSKGLKTYRMQNFDLIGVNERMINIYKKVNKELSSGQKAYIYAIDRSKELTSTQKDAIIEQTLFTEVQRKSSVFSGIYAEQMNTTAGRVSKLKTKLSDLSTEMGTILLPYVEILVDKISILIEEFEKLPEETRKNIVKIAGLGIAFGLTAGTILMFGGNLIWALAQLAHLKGAIRPIFTILLPFAIMIAGVVFALEAWIKIGLGVAVMIGNLEIKLLELNIAMANDLGPQLIKTTNLYIQEANAIIDLINWTAKLAGIQGKFAKIELLPMENIDKAISSYEKKIKDIEQTNKDLIATQTYMNKMPLMERLRYNLFGEEKTNEPAAGGGSTSAAGQGAGEGQTNMYGDLIIYTSGTGSPVYQGSGMNMERSIELLLSTLAQNQQNG